MQKPKVSFSPSDIAIAEQPKLYIETYGCQMNVSDSEVVAALMQKEGYALVNQAEGADVILLNTCSIRENAEQRVWKRLEQFRFMKRRQPGLRIGVIGCMAERLKESLVEEEKSVDVVVGPDAYRQLPQLLTIAETGQKGINTLLSIEETYADVSPVRYDSNGVSAFVSIMRGCNNFCSFCVVPYTRGRERSRDLPTIVGEAGQLFKAGYHEVTLLGQNVNSYLWRSGDNESDFADLLEKVAQISPLLRVRFSTSHPKDLSDKLIDTMAKYPNICRHFHLPAQSGSSLILGLMNRRYTREWFLDRVKALRTAIPDISLTTDIIAGFCGETEEDHQHTLSLMREAGFDYAYMFKYSERPDTRAQKQLTDDVPEEVKSRRLSEIIELQNQLSLESNRRDVGKTFEVLAEGFSKRSTEQLFGRNSQNKVVIFPAAGHHKGDYVLVRITNCTSATLIGELA